MSRFGREYSAVLGMVIDGRRYGVVLIKRRGQVIQMTEGEVDRVNHPCARGGLFRRFRFCGHQCGPHGAQFVNIEAGLHDQTRARRACDIWSSGKLLDSSWFTSMAAALADRSVAELTASLEYTIALTGFGSETQRWTAPVRVRSRYPRASERDSVVGSCLGAVSGAVAAKFFLPLGP